MNKSLSIMAKRSGCRNKYPVEEIGGKKGSRLWVSRCSEHSVALNDAMTLLFEYFSE